MQRGTCGKPLEKSTIRLPLNRPLPLLTLIVLIRNAHILNQGSVRQISCKNHPTVYRMVIARFPSFLAISLLLFACHAEAPDNVPHFETLPQSFSLAPGLVDEVSGITPSQNIPGNLWAEQDGGNPSQLALLSPSAQLVGHIDLPLPNRDWEDMTLGAGPKTGVPYIYLADIGDNNATNDVNYIYRFPEPKSLTDQVTSAERIAFRYPDGPRDAEALLLDPLTKDIWIISKRESRVHLYRLAYPQNTTAVSEAEAVGSLPISYVVSACFSADGHQLIVKTYTNLYYWARNGTESVADALQKRSYQELPYRLEPQGEAVCFDGHGSGYYTLSERASAASVSLNYYARK